MHNEECRGKYKCSHGAGPFIGRLLISIVFILAGIGKIIDFRGATETLNSMGIVGAKYFMLAALLLELVGGLLLLLGWYTRVGIIILMIFMFPVTFMFHAFWNYSGAEMAMQISNFLKNLAIYGGLFAFYSFGPGRWSVDACRGCKERCE